MACWCHDFLSKRACPLKVPARHEMLSKRLELEDRAGQITLAGGDVMGIAVLRPFMTSQLFGSEESFDRSEGRPADGPHLPLFTAATWRAEERFHKPVCVCKVTTIFRHCSPVHPNAGALPSCQCF